MFIYVCNGWNGKFPAAISVDMRESYINLIRHDHRWLKWAYTSKKYEEIMQSLTSDDVDPIDIARRLEECLDTLAVCEFERLYTKVELADDNSKIYYDVYKYTQQSTDKDYKTLAV